MNTVLKLSAALALVLTATGCVPIEDLLEDEDPCLRELGTAQVGGTWRITGQGSRSACTEERFNADEMDIRSIPLEIKQEGEVLTLAGNIDGFTFSNGKVDGSCVSFTTVEEARTPVNNLVFRWSGTVREDGLIVGSFDGEGPQSCVASGSFNIDVQ